MGLSASPGSTTYPVWVPTVMAEQGANGPSYSEGLQMWGALNPHSSPRRAWGTARPWLGVGRVKVGALDSVQKRETAGVRLARGPDLAPFWWGDHLGLPPTSRAFMPGFVPNTSSEDPRKVRNFL